MKKLSYKNVKTTLIIIIIFLGFLPACNIVNAQSDNQENVVGVSSKINTNMTYFYVTGCDDCEEVMTCFSQMDETYNVNYNNTTLESTLSIEPYNIVDAENLESLYKYFELYNVPKDRQFVPIIFIGDEYLLGADEIKGELIKLIESGIGIESDSVASGLLEDTNGSDINLSEKKILGVLLTGLVNGLNPCSISMLLFFASLLLAKNINVLKAGLSFVCGKFIMYILLGTIFYNILLKFNLSWLNIVIKIILIVLFSLLALMNIWDFFAVKKEKYNSIRLQLPQKLRKINHKMINKFTSKENMKGMLFLSFGLGALISIGEFLCTGQIYLATIIYVLQNSVGFDIKAFLYLVMYSAAFALPLLIITVIVHRSKDYFNISEMVRGKMHIIKLINAIVFLVFLALVIILY